MLNISDLFDLNDTIAADLFAGKTYPWEVLGEISDFIVKLGATLSPEEYDHPAEDVWIAKDAKVFPSAYIGGPCIIDHEAEIRHCAFIRGSAIVGKKAVVGNSVEL
ncbi:MAG: UDP-N-acetylglucosamine pyrophosphorylase, partial [Evtepia sp.]